MRFTIPFIFFALISIEITAQDMIDDPNFPCLYCGTWTFVNPFSSNRISGGLYILDLVASTNEFKYPANNGATYSIHNEGGGTVRVIISDAVTNNGSFELETGAGVSFGDLYNPTDNSSRCYKSSNPRIQTKVELINISGTEIQLTIYATPSSFTCISGFIGKGEVWKIILQ